MRRLIFILCLVSFQAQAQRFVKVFDTLRQMVEANTKDVHTNAFVVGRTTANDGFQGDFSYISSSSSSTNLGTVFMPTNSIGRWIRQYSGPVNVQWFGAVGDSITDNLKAITNAIATVSTGGTIYFPSGTYKVTNSMAVSSPITIMGDSSGILQGTASTNIFYVTANNVLIKGLKLSGQGNGSTKLPETAIWVEGTVSSYLTNIVVKNCHIDYHGGYGIYARFVRQFDFSENIITRIGYGGIMGSSCSDGLIARNRIKAVTPGSGGNAYGISLTRITTGTLATDPRSSDVNVENNSVADITLWEALDTHGGVRINFVGNVITNCAYGIAVGGSRNSGGTDQFAPRECNVIGNIMDSGLSDGTGGSGILFGGDSEYGENATGSITGNTIMRYGTGALNLTGGIRVQETVGLVISANTILNPSPNGIVLVKTNMNAIITGNNIVDPWWSSGSAYGVYIPGNENWAHITGNTFGRSTNTAAVVATAAIRSEATTSRIGVGLNFLNLTNYTSLATTPYSTNWLKQILPGNLQVNESNGSLFGFFDNSTFDHSNDRGLFGYLSQMPTNGQAVFVGAGNSAWTQSGEGALVLGSRSSAGRAIEMYTGSTTPLLRWYVDSLGALTGTTNYVQMSEMTAPSAPGADAGRLYLEDNGGGKTRLVIKFNTGAAQVIATQP